MMDYVCLRSKCSNLTILVVHAFFLGRKHFVTKNRNFSKKISEYTVDFEYMLRFEFLWFKWALLFVEISTADMNDFFIRTVLK